jgi:hypothetical protein
MEKMSTPTVSSSTAASPSSPQTKRKPLNPDEEFGGWVREERGKRKRRQERKMNSL